MKISAIILIILCLGVSAILVGCLRHQPSKSHSEIVHGALISLLKRPAEAFVIFEEPKSGKFVQFAGSIEEPLLLDLPIQTLSPAEIEKAKTIFGEMGYSGPEIKKGLMKIGQNYKGVTGIKTFDEYGDVTGQFVPYIVKNGNFVKYSR